VNNLVNARMNKTPTDALVSSWRTSGSSGPSRRPGRSVRHDNHPDGLRFFRSRVIWRRGTRRTASPYRYETAKRGQFCVTPYGEAAERLVTNTTFKAAETLSDPTGLISCLAETLQVAAIDISLGAGLNLKRRETV
jgi:hypothetical protein